MQKFIDVDFHVTWKAHVYWLLLSAPPRECSTYGPVDLLYT